MPPYDFVCEDCGRPVDGNIDGRCAACREEGEFTTFPRPNRPLRCPFGLVADQQRSGFRAYAGSVT